MLFSFNYIFIFYPYFQEFFHFVLISIRLPVYFVVVIILKLKNKQTIIRANN